MRTRSESEVTGVQACDGHDRRGIRRDGAVMRAAGIMGLSLAAAGITAAAGAQSPNVRPMPETGTRLGGHTGSIASIGEPVQEGDETTASARDTGLITQQFARCVAARQPAMVDQYLATPFESGDADAATPAYKKIKAEMPGCLGTVGWGHGMGATSLKLSGYLFRGLLAEARFAAMRYPATPAALAVRQGYSYPWVSTNPQQRTVDEMGACLAEWRPAESTALIRTPPGSRAEHDAFGTLMPLLQACLTRGATLTSSPAGVRSAIAIGLYHRATDAAAPAATAAAKSS